MGSSAHHHDVELEIVRVRSAVEDRLRRILDPDMIGEDMVGHAMREAVLGPGKRLRPLLAVLAARDLGVETPVALEAGCAVELVHTASLVLDDLPSMDNSPTRRGRASLHMVYGEDVAVLAAIGLLARAFDVAAAAPTDDPADRARLVSEISRSVGVHGLVGGQYADLRTTGGAGSMLSDINDRKTGALFVAAVNTAAIVARADTGARAALGVFARELGRAFQIMDDMADAADDGVTLVTAFGAEAAARRLSQHVDGALAALRRLPAYPLRLSALMEMMFATAAPARAAASTVVVPAGLLAGSEPEVPT